MVYAQVGHSYAAGWGASTGSTLWNVMQSASKSNPKMHAIKIEEEVEVFASFKKIYGKAAKAKA
jgi:hypothetical protein